MASAKQQAQRNQKAAKRNARNKKRNQRAASKEDKIVSNREKARIGMSKSRHLKRNTPEGHAQQKARQRRDIQKWRSKMKAREEEICSCPPLSPPFPPPTSSNRKGSTVYVSVGSSLVLSKASVEQTGASVAGLSVDQLSPVEQTEHINRGRGIQ